MAVHQPVLTPHHVPRWLEDVAAGVVGAVLVVGLLLIAGHTDILPTITTETAPAPPALVVSGSNGGGIEYTGIPYPARAPVLRVSGSDGGGIIYTGIPYPARAPVLRVSGSNGGGIIYTGIPYPATGEQ
jgi:hypothetical protein